MDTTSTTNAGDSAADAAADMPAVLVPMESTVQLIKNEPRGEDKAQTNTRAKRVSYFSLYRFADWRDLLMVFLGVASSLIHGALTPMFAIILGSITDAFTSPATLQETVNSICVWFLILGGIAFVSTFFQTWCFIWSGERQANRIRRLFFRGVMRQNIGWFDMNDSSALTSRVASDVLLIQDAISEQVGTFLQYTSQFLVGIIVGFSKGWRMTFVVLSLIPPLVICGVILAKLTSRYTARTQAAQSHAGAVAEEVFSSIRTVMAFGGEAAEIDRYETSLHVATKSSNFKAQIHGIGLGMVYFVAFAAFGLAFYYGSVLVQDGTSSAGDVLTVFFSVVVGATGIGQAAPSLGAFAQGAGAASMIFEVISREPEIDVMSGTGVKLGDEYKANLRFNGVHFSYPSRPDVPILRGLDLDMRSGQTIALVGLSGSGKSTIVALLERFYDPLQGTITLDGADTRELNLPWLRSQIALVQQEPILFATTIGQNIALGSLRDDVTPEEIEAAAREANAHDFISLLPLKYDTLVGERGVQLSGGQKQRIAIARALIKKPKILLLDEATSALDSGSERVVQDALDRARQGRTTIVIAHRLSTIRDADDICVMVKGQLVEKGTHADLIEKGELYASLVATQQVPLADGEKPSGPKTDEADEELRQKVAAGTLLQQTNSDSAKKDDPDDNGASEPQLTPAEAHKAKGALRRAFSLHRPDWFLVLLGLLGALGHGVMLPLFTLIFSQMLYILVEFNIPALFDPNDLRTKANFWSGMFVVLAAGSGIFNYMQSAFLTTAGDRLTERLRNKLFRAVIRQDLSWFDQPENDVGRLTTKLASDALLVESATGMRWGIATEIVASLTAGLVVAFTASWKIALIMLACFPLLFSGGIARTRLRAGFSIKTKKAFESAGQLASECVSSMRTVASLGREIMFQEKYTQLVEEASGTLVSGILSALGFAVSELFSMPIWALAFWVGAQFVLAGEIDFGQLMTAIMAIIFGGFSVGRLTAVAPNVGKARLAAKDIFEIIDHEPTINALAENGHKPEAIIGAIEFENLNFEYPLRKDVTVLSNLSLSVPAGKTVALVGQSGCGKSTLISLLERFYEQKAGTVKVDSHDTQGLNVHWLRQQLGLVSQEPILFARSIKENIRYGRPDASDEDIYEVAKEANIHNFILTLPDQYDTFVGEKGTQLSGGQKQRVAIARALLRKPKILLLDEATSALDSESERLVQAALEQAMKGRTTILIAHRLSTVVNADIIAVVHKGVIDEQGTHEELLARHGKYFELVQNQVNAL